MLPGTQILSDLFSMIVAPSMETLYVAFQSARPLPASNVTPFLRKSCQQLLKLTWIEINRGPNDRFPGYSPDFANILVHVPNVEELVISDCVLNDSFLEALMKASQEDEGVAAQLTSLKIAGLRPEVYFDDFMLVNAARARCSGYCAKQMTRHFLPGQMLEEMIGIKDLQHLEFEADPGLIHSTVLSLEALREYGLNVVTNTKLLAY